MASDSQEVCCQVEDVEVGGGRGRTPDRLRGTCLPIGAGLSPDRGDPSSSEAVGCQYEVKYIVRCSDGTVDNGSWGDSCSNGACPSGESTNSCNGGCCVTTLFRNLRSQARACLE